MAEFIGENLTDHGVKLLRGYVPTTITKIKDGKPGMYLVKAKQTEGDQTWEEEFNTIVFAIGRDPCTTDLKLENTGVQINKKYVSTQYNKAKSKYSNSIFFIEFFIR